MTTEQQILAALVRPLEFVKHPAAEIWRSDTMIGTYKIFGIGPLPSWDFDSATVAQDRTTCAAETIEVAQAAAEADYHARIAAALDLGKLVALVEAAKQVSFNHHHGNGLQAHYEADDKLDAALAALARP